MPDNYRRYLGEKLKTTEEQVECSISEFKPCDLQKSSFPVENEYCVIVALCASVEVVHALSFLI